MYNRDRITVGHIHVSLVNGQRKQAVSQINDFQNETGEEFWPSYEEYLKDMCDYKTAFKYLADMIKAYTRRN